VSERHDSVSAGRWIAEVGGEMERDRTSAYRSDIDGLRAVAVGLVLLYHAELGFDGGYIGVDVFLVISGYLITGIIRKQLAAGSFSLSNFWRRRVSRIVPAATLTTVLTVLAGWFLLLPREFADLASSAFAQQLMLANVYFFERLDYFDGPAELKPLLHMWSLAVEEQFYLVYPFLLIAIHRISARAILPVLLAIAVLSFGWSVFRVENDPAAAFFLLPSRSWELLVGALLHWCPPLPEGRSRLAGLLSATGLGAIVLAALTYDGAMPFPGAAALVPTLGTAMIIHAGRRPGGVGSALLGNRPMVFVGLISYSLYLVHWPIIVYLRHHHDGTLPWRVGLVAVLLSLVIASASWWWFERPLRSIGSSIPTRRVVGAFGISTACLAGVFLSIHLLDGLPRRFDPDLRLAVSTPMVDKDLFRNRHQVDRDHLPLRGPCGDSVDVLLWGDSHAAAIEAAFSDACRELGLCGAIASKTRTLPLLGCWRPGRMTDATTWNESVLEYISRHRVEHVVLVGRWAVNLEGEPGEPDDRSTLLMDATSTEPSHRDAARVFSTALDATIDAIRARGAGVVILEQFPLQSVDPMRLLVHELETGSPSESLTSLEQHRSRQRRVRVELERVASRGDAILVDPSDEMFESRGGVSWSVVGDHGGCFYADDDHPSAYGARRFVSPILREALATSQAWFESDADGSARRAAATADGPNDRR